ncbi:Aminopeptidase M1-B [Thelohanellus kitauei]|uniref:Aminopeptidase M1-B n=1 Tax=Thelohanellus kitauei TaxID=669202 RepID=A0A0C2MW90_THEKT|nr:Aminopeptidase M1-B [Thelohanellus kitauei]
MNALGEDLFFTCIQVLTILTKNYLKKFAYSNANSHDLWSIVKKESKIDYIEPMMKAWTYQPGFPLITIKKSNTTGEYHVHQYRFLVTSDEKKRIKENEYVRVMISPTFWIVPIVYITASEDTPKLLWLNRKDGIVRAILDYLKLSTKDEWVKINYRFGSYYRSHYEDDSIIQLSRDLMNNNSVK